MSLVLLGTISFILLIWCLTGSVHWATAMTTSGFAVILGGIVMVLGALNDRHKLNNAYWAKNLDIQRFHGFGALGWMLLAMMVLTVISLMPMPLGLIEILSPKSAAIYAESWQLTGIDAGWGRLTAASGKTAFALWMLIGFFGVYLCAMRLGSTRQRVSRISHVMVIVGSIFIALLLLKLIGHPVSFGQSGAQAAWHIGLPVNANHLSSVMVMFSLMALGASLSKRHRNSHARRAMWILVYLVFGVTTLMLKSRGAILAWGLGHLVIIAMYLGAIRQMKWQTGAFVMGGMAVVFALTLVISAPTISSIAQEYEETYIVFDSDEVWDVSESSATKKLSKTQLYGDFIPMVKDWGVSGTGRSAFGDIYPAYQGFAFLKRFRHAENEYFELILEYGWLGGMLCILLGIVGIILWIRCFWKASDESKFFIGCLAAVIAVLIQNVFDFGLRYWTVGMPFWIACGLLESRRLRWKFGKSGKDTEATAKSVNVEHNAGVVIWMVAIIVAAIFSTTAIEGQTEVELKQLQKYATQEKCVQNLAIRPASTDVRKIMGFAEIEKAGALKNIEQKKQHWANARQWLESAHAAAPRDAQTSLHLAKVCLVLDDLDCATTHFFKTIENNPKLRALVMYEMAGMHPESLVLPSDASSRASLVGALSERGMHDTALQLVHKLPDNPQNTVERTSLLCRIYQSIDFMEGCDAAVEALSDIPESLTHLNLKAQYLIRHQEWETLFKLYESVEKTYQDSREYWRQRLYHSVFYGKHRSPEWYHAAIPQIFWRHRQVSNSDKIWRFDDAYCGAFYALEMKQFSRAIRDANTALSIKPRHKGAQNILKEAEKRQK